MSSGHVEVTSRGVGAGGAGRPSVGAALRWALVGVAAGTVVSGFRVLSGVAAPGAASNGSVAPAARSPLPGPGAAPTAAPTADPTTVPAVDSASDGVAGPPPLPPHERVLVTVASPAGAPYRRPAPLLMRLPGRPAAARGNVPG